MKKLFLAFACLGLMTCVALAQTATLSFNDGVGTSNAGNYAPGATFSFNITLFTSGQAANDRTAGLSYWFETSGIASTNTYFTLTGRSFTDTVPPFSNGTSPFSAQIQGQPPSSPIIAGGNQFDLGGTDPNLNFNGGGQAPNGTYFVATITIQISGAAVNGTYMISTTTISSPTNQFHTSAGSAKSEASNNVGGNGMPFADVNIPATDYFITIIPEPATWSLIGLGALSVVGLNVLRARKKG